jgi:hypothetical protein
MVADAEQRSNAIFNLKPRAPVDVRREPPLTEAVGRRPLLAAGAGRQPSGRLLGADARARAST